jgi:ATP/maltotriose-dependent transcriptional regulator MalT
VDPSDDPLALGRAALARGEWSAARTRFEEALRPQETAAALEGLAMALLWLDEAGPSLECRSRAYALHREAGDLCAAARNALWLAMGHVSAFGSLAVASGWLQRAERLLDEVGPCVERGWFEHLRGKMAGDAAVTARHAEEAVAIARRHRDQDLEVWALSEHGRALVALGRVAEGMAMLDEAVAAATGGEARDLFVVGHACCNMLSACDRAADFQRAAQWCQVVDDFTKRYHSTPIFHYCRVVFAGVLIATGRWDEAEDELMAALRAVERTYPVEKIQSLSRLALLRVRRGRLEEAGQLLSGLETQGAAAEAAACLSLARGDAERAAALVERRIGVTGEGLASVPMLAIAVEARLALRDLEAARAAAMRLGGIAQRAGRAPIHGVAELARSRVEQAGGGASDAFFARACERFEEAGMPFEAAVARLEWAEAQAAAGTAGMAAEDARSALAAFEKLGARPRADRAAALLRELGAGTRPGPRVAGELTRREHEVLELLSHGLSNGEIGERLFISPKTVEHHVGRILGKLSLRNRAEAAAWRLRHRLAAGTSAESGPK